MPDNTIYKSLDYEFGNSLKKFRKQAQLKQAELAELIGVSIRTVNSWEAGNTYPQMPRLQHLIQIFLERGGFTPNHERQEAARLWEKAISAKSDSQNAFNIAWFSSLLQAKKNSSQTTKKSNRLLTYQDWGEAVDVSGLYGREDELARLENQTIEQRCRVVALLGMGGIGKTSLAVTFARQVAPRFEYVLFRSLRNAPPPAQFLDNMLRFLANHQLTELPTDVNGKIALLVDYLRQYRCLIVLDNLETVMQEGLQAGQYRPDYAAYGNLIQQLAEMEHQSCLLLTSRERPQELSALEGKTASVQVIVLSGLNEKTCQKLLSEAGIATISDNWAILSRRYGGNPLALKLVSEPIREIFGGDISAFLSTEGAIFGGIRHLLEQQFARLSEIEQDLIYWLAIGREPIDFETLRTQSLLPASVGERLEALKALNRRFLIERTELATSFTLQPVVMEYVVEQLISRIQTEIIQAKPDLLCRYALMQAQTREYIRQSQLQVIIQPLLGQLITNLKNLESFEGYIQRMLAAVRQLPRAVQGYATGNCINLLVQAGCELQGQDFSNLNIWQAYLTSIELRDVNMTGADLSNTTFTESFATAFCLAFSPNSKFLAAGSSNGAVKIWQLSSLNSFGSQPVLECKGHRKLVSAVAFSPNGRLLASSSEDGTVRLWEIVGGSCVAVLEGHTGSVRSIAFSPDGNWLASGGIDEKVCLWQVATANLMATLPDQNSWIMALAFSPDSKLLATGNFDASVKLWDVKMVGEAPQLINTLTNHTAWISALAFSPDGSTLASGSADQTICLWSPGNGERITVLQGHSAGIMALAFSPDGQNLVSSSNEAATIKLWSAKTHEVLATLQGYVNRVHSIAISPDGQQLAASASNNKILIWQLDNKTQQTPARALTGHNNLVRTVAFNPVGNMLASGCSDGIIKLWRNGSTRAWATLLGHAKPVTTMIFHCDGKILVSASEDGTLKIWSVISGDCLATLTAGAALVRTIAFSPDGKTLASSGEDGQIRLWDFSKGLPPNQAAKSWDSQIELVITLAYNPSGLGLASAGSDHSIKLWKIGEGESPMTLTGHTGYIWSIAFSPDGQILATGSDDGLVKLWNVTNGQLIADFEHTNRVISLTFTPDGSQLVSAGESGLIKLWSLADGGKLTTNLRSRQPYEDLNISGVSGLTAAQRTTLHLLGAIEAIDPDIES